MASTTFRQKDPLSEAIAFLRLDYHPSATVPELLGRFLTAAMEITESDEGVICLKESGPGQQAQTNGVWMQAGGKCKATGDLPLKECPLCLGFLERGENTVLIDGGSGGENHCTRFTLPGRATLAVPLRYQGVAFGSLAMLARDRDEYSTGHRDACLWIASELTYHLKRHELHEASKAAMSKSLMFVGISEAMRRIDEFIEKASKVDLPALIQGEFGSEKRQIACALHLGGKRAYPFIEVRCAALDAATLKRIVTDKLRRAVEGTIFFNGIDELDYQRQSQLSEAIEVETEQWANSADSSIPAGARLIASASRNLDELSSEGKFCRPLLEKFDFLLAEISPLRKRKEDIRPLSEYFLERHADRPNLRFSPQVLDALEAYDWPKNSYELERVVARLAVMVEGDLIRMPDLNEHAPDLARKLQAGGSSPMAAESPPSYGFSQVSAALQHQRTPVRASIVGLAQDLRRNNFTNINHCHPALASALKYIANNLHEGISLQDLARHACVSASHLAYLFQKSLSVNFKLFLAVIRIEEAKELLADKPHMRITDISFQVGFGDLRHFERTFKRLSGQSPREYRMAVLGQDAADADSSV